MEGKPNKYALVAHFDVLYVYATPVRYERSKLPNEDFEKNGFLCFPKIVTSRTQESPRIFTREMQWNPNKYRFFFFVNNTSGILRRLAIVSVHSGTDTYSSVPVRLPRLNMAHVTFSSRDRGRAQKIVMAGGGVSTISQVRL